MSIDGFSRLGFTSCEVPKMTISTTSYPEGGSHLFPKQIIDSIQYKPITLTRGVTSDTSFLTWVRNLIKNYAYGSFRTIDDENITQVRKTVTIQHLDRKGRPVRTYTLYNAFPIEYEPASDFSADGDDTVSMEKLVLTYESFTVEIIGEENKSLDVTDVAKKLFR